MLRSIETLIRNFNTPPPTEIRLPRLSESWYISIFVELKFVTVYLLPVICGFSDCVKCSEAMPCVFFFIFRKVQFSTSFLRCWGSSVKFLGLAERVFKVIRARF